MNLYSNVRTFLADPMGCEEDVVNILKDAARRAFDIQDDDIRISPNGGDGIRITRSNGDFVVVFVNEDGEFDNWPSTRQISSRPDAANITCDGGCGRTFNPSWNTTGKNGDRRSTGWKLRRPQVQV